MRCFPTRSLLNNFETMRSVRNAVRLVPMIFIRSCLFSREPCETVDNGRFPFDQNFLDFYEMGLVISREKFRKSGNCWFPKSEPLNLKFRKFRDENPMHGGHLPFDQKFRNFSKRGQMVRKFPKKSFRKSENYWISEKRTIPPKFSFSFSALASSFDCHHCELDISRKDDGDEYSIKETL